MPLSVDPRAPAPTPGMSRSRQRQPGERSFVNRMLWGSLMPRASTTARTENVPERVWGSFQRPAFTTPDGGDQAESHPAKRAPATPSHSCGYNAPFHQSAPSLRRPLSAARVRTLHLRLPARTANLHPSGGRSNPSRSEKGLSKPPCPLHAATFRSWGADREVTAQSHTRRSAVGRSRRERTARRWEGAVSLRDRTITADTLPPSSRRLHARRSWVERLRSRGDLERSSGRLPSRTLRLAGRR